MMRDPVSVVEDLHRPKLGVGRVFGFSGAKEREGKRFGRVEIGEPVCGMWERERE